MGGKDGNSVIYFQVKENVCVCVCVRAPNTCDCSLDIIDGEILQESPPALIFQPQIFAAGCVCRWQRRALIEVFGLMR